MATFDERRALLAVTCPHCSAEPGTVCFVPIGARTETARSHSRRAPIRTLDGGMHDARWRKALDREARVIREALPPTRTSGARVPELVDAGGVERPW